MVRSLFERRMDALVVLNERGNLSITNLMHYSKLSGEDNVLVIRELVKRGLVEFFKSTRERKKLQLTDAGRIVLSHYQAIRRALE